MGTGRGARRVVPHAGRHRRQSRAARRHRVDIPRRLSRPDRVARDRARAAVGDLRPPVHQRRTAALRVLHDLGSDDHSRIGAARASPMRSIVALGAFLWHFALFKPNGLVWALFFSRRWSRCSIASGPPRNSNGANRHRCASCGSEARNAQKDRSCQRRACALLAVASAENRIGSQWHTRAIAHGRCRRLVQSARMRALLPRWKRCAAAPQLSYANSRIGRAELSRDAIGENALRVSRNLRTFTPPHAADASRTRPTVAAATAAAPAHSATVPSTTRPARRSST